MPQKDTPETPERFRIYYQKQRFQYIETEELQSKQQESQMNQGQNTRHFITDWIKLEHGKKTEQFKQYHTVYFYFGIEVDQRRTLGAWGKEGWL